MRSRAKIEGKRGGVVVGGRGEERRRTGGEKKSEKCFYISLYIYIVYICSQCGHKISIKQSIGRTASRYSGQC